MLSPLLVIQFVNYMPSTETKIIVKSISFIFWHTVLRCWHPTWAQRTKPHERFDTEKYYKGFAGNSNYPHSPGWNGTSVPQPHRMQISSQQNGNFALRTFLGARRNVWWLLTENSWVFEETDYHIVVSKRIRCNDTVPLGLYGCACELRDVVADWHIFPHEDTTNGR